MVNINETMVRIEINCIETMKHVHTEMNIRRNINRENF